VLVMWPEKHLALPAPPNFPLLCRAPSPTLANPRLAILRPSSRGYLLPPPPPWGNTLGLGHAGTSLCAPSKEETPRKVPMEIFGVNGFYNCSAPCPKETARTIPATCSA